MVDSGWVLAPNKAISRTPTAPQILALNPMEILTTKELEKINKWQPIASGFGRFNKELFSKEIYPIIKNLEDEGYICEILEDGGMATFFSLSISKVSLNELNPYPNKCLDQFAREALKN